MKGKIKVLVFIGLLSVGVATMSGCASGGGFSDTTHTVGPDGGVTTTVHTPSTADQIGSTLGICNSAATFANLLKAL